MDWNQWPSLHWNQWPSLRWNQWPSLDWNQWPSLDWNEWPTFTGMGGPVWTGIPRKAFPTILAECRLLKRDDHCVLSQDLQKMESKFIYHCLEVCAKTLGHVPLTTIHDAIVSTEENIYIVEQIVINAFNKLNIKPTVKVKKL